MRELPLELVYEDMAARYNAVHKSDKPNRRALTLSRSRMVSHVERNLAADAYTNFLNQYLHSSG